MNIILMILEIKQYLKVSQIVYTIETGKYVKRKLVWWHITLHKCILQQWVETKIWELLHGGLAWRSLRKGILFFQIIILFVIIGLMIIFPNSLYV